MSLLLWTFLSWDFPKLRTIFEVYFIWTKVKNYKLSINEYFFLYYLCFIYTFFGKCTQRIFPLVFKDLKYEVYLLSSVFSQCNYILCIFILEKLDEIIYKNLFKDWCFQQKGIYKMQYAPIINMAFVTDHTVISSTRKKVSLLFFIVSVAVIISVANLVGYCIRWF